MFVLLLWSTVLTIIVFFFFQENGEIFQSNVEEPLGRGMAILRRKEISPGMHSKLTIANVEKVGKWNDSTKLKTSHEHETKQSPILGLLDLLDRYSDCDSKSTSELNTSHVSDEKNSSVEYIPAGANVHANNKKSKNQSGIYNTSSVNKGRPSVDVRNHFKSESFLNTKKCDGVLDTLPKSTSVSLDSERNEVQSSIVTHSERNEQIAIKRRPLSLLECLQAKVNRIIKTSVSTTENGDVQCDITRKEKSVPTRSLFQDIVNSVEKSTQSKRQDLLHGLKKNSRSPSSIPDTTARLPQAALTAVLERETSGKDTKMKSVNSLAR